MVLRITKAKPKPAFTAADASRLYHDCRTFTPPPMTPELAAQVAELREVLQARRVINHLPQAAHQAIRPGRIMLNVDLTQWQKACLQLRPVNRKPVK